MEHRSEQCDLTLGEPRETSWRRTRKEEGKDLVGRGGGNPFQAEGTVGAKALRQQVIGSDLVQLKQHVRGER